jgi:hypothetical protein
MQKYYFISTDDFRFGVFEIEANDRRTACFKLLWELQIHDEDWRLEEDGDFVAVSFNGN